MPIVFYWLCPCLKLVVVPSDSLIPLLWRNTRTLHLLMTPERIHQWCSQNCLITVDTHSRKCCKGSGLASSPGFAAAHAIVTLWPLTLQAACAVKGHTVVMMLVGGEPGDEVRSGLGGGVTSHCQVKLCPSIIECWVYIHWTCDLCCIHLHLMALCTV